MRCDVNSNQANAKALSDIYVSDELQKYRNQR